MTAVWWVVKIVAAIVAFDVLLLGTLMFNHWRHDRAVRRELFAELDHILSTNNQEAHHER